MSDIALRPGPPPIAPVALAAFEAHYEAHAPAVHATAARLCGPEAAADVTQEVFLHLWRHPDAFDARRGSLRSYLLTITHHRSVDLLRTGTARRGREARAGQPGEPPPSVEATVIGCEQSIEIAAALDRLPSGERAAIVVSFYGGLTYREAAIALGEPEGTVKSRIRSGLTRLRKSIPQLGWPSANPAPDATTPAVGAAGAVVVSCSKG